MHTFSNVQMGFLRLFYSYYSKWYFSNIRLILYNRNNNNIIFNGKRGPKSKFTDVACPNKNCKLHGISGKGNVVAMAHIKPKMEESEKSSATNAAECSVNAQILSFIIFIKTSSSFN